MIIYLCMAIQTIILIEAILLLQLIRVTLRLWRWDRAAGMILPGDPVYREADGRLRAARPGDSPIVGIALEDGSIATHGRVMVSTPSLGEDDWFTKKWREAREG